MSNKRPISWRSIILTASAFLIVGFLGVLAGNWFVGWRQARANKKLIRNYVPAITNDFSRGQQFPNVDLIDIDGDPVNTDSFIGLKKTAFIFLAPGCDPCHDVVQLWSRFVDRIPSDLQVIGICNGGYESGRKYIQEEEFPYPAYFDTAHTFAKDYRVYQYPNVMGLTGDGRIAFVNRGLYGQFNPLDAYEMISESAGELQ